MNGIGPRNFNPNMKADLAKQVKDLGKLDEGKALGEAQEANVTNKPEGDTDVNKTVVVTWGEDANGEYGIKGVYYDGIDNGVLIHLNEDGSFQAISVDEQRHNVFKPEGA